MHEPFQMHTYLRDDALVASLERLADLAASSDTGGAAAAAQLLLALYNGREYPMDLPELCRLDEDLFEDALKVIRLRIRNRIEPHEFFVDGGALFTFITDKWQITGKSDQLEEMSR